MGLVDGVHFGTYLFDIWWIFPADCNLYLAVNRFTLTLPLDEEVVNCPSVIAEVNEIVEQLDIIFSDENCLLPLLLVRSMDLFHIVAAHLLLNQSTESFFTPSYRKVSTLL